MNQMIVRDVIVKGNRIDIDYSVSGEWENFFQTEEVFYVEYSKDIGRVPQGVAIIPFLCNVLPIAWVFDAELIVNEIDKAFYESIDNFKQGYIDMYPQLNFSGKLNAKKIVDNPASDLKNSAAFFSGGVDAYQTLISHIEEKPILVTLWGSDIKLEDTKGWKVVEAHTKQVATEYNLDYVVIKSSFRKFLNEGELSQYTASRVKDGWWHGFQHGIGLIGHMAPYAYQYKIKNVYIASSFTIKDKGKVTCASDPSIDNHVRFNGSKVFHDGYEYNRQAKIHRICEYVKGTGTKIQLRVCWESRGGSNCCRCEKCYRTILGIIAEKEDPRFFGFEYTDDEFINMMQDFRRKVFVRISNYIPIQTAMRDNYSIEQIDSHLKWFYKINVNQLNRTMSKNIFRLKRKVTKILKG